MWRNFVNSLAGVPVIVWIPELGWKTCTVTVENDLVRVSPTTDTNREVVMHIDRVCVRTK